MSWKLFSFQYVRKILKQKVFFLYILILYYIKQINSKFPCVCSVMVRTSKTHLAITSCATFLFLPHFDVIFDLSMNRHTATWNLLVKLVTGLHTALPLSYQATCDLVYQFQHLDTFNLTAVCFAVSHRFKRLRQADHIAERKARKQHREPHGMFYSFRLVCGIFNVPQSI